ncbi:hypothetical protein FGO68_gene2264 [Halteria grandinella]|uniref:Uncharacterized protein n=1 Tax=Halteria grandinella TaxID=5974 RepID=A0A8J8NJT5_HALGN|nr:hypothetical protein FGO68_gene2264 [Halteria grandinella]
MQSSTSRSPPQCRVTSSMPMMTLRARPRVSPSPQFPAARAAWARTQVFRCARPPPRGTRSRGSSRSSSGRSRRARRQRGGCCRRRTRGAASSEQPEKLPVRGQKR